LSLFQLISLFRLIQTFKKFSKIFV
jgi:hypothetical protein